MAKVTVSKTFDLWNAPSHTEIPYILMAARNAGLNGEIATVRNGYFKSRYVIVVTGDAVTAHRFLALIR